MPLTARDALAIASAALAATALGAGVWLLLAPGDAGVAADPSLGILPASPGVVPASASPSVAGEMLVDVQGGVQRPGLVRLPPGSRIADAIEAAGGYAEQADLLAAAAAVNLAAPLTDGQQVFVPLQGVAGGGDGGSGGDGGGSLVNLNSATPEQLEALPGIGPVTVQKIVAARQEQPFGTLDELVERKVMNRGQLDGIRELVTV